MDAQARLLIRLAQWLRRRPPKRVIVLMLAVLLVSIVVALFESLHGWPAWLTVDQGPRVVR
jgi:hypothetical protein